MKAAFTFIGDRDGKPLAIDLFCGLGGWTEGLLAEGYRVVGFDMERHHYGDAKYPAQLVLQDVLTIHGRQFKDAALIVASPPCQEYSYMAMPWSLAKEKRRKLREGEDDPKRLTALFDACFRIQREASEAAGHHIPLVVENVRGAQEWVGRSRFHFGSFHLWGDVPALMPQVKTNRKTPVGSWDKTRKNYTADHSWDTEPAKGYGVVTEDGIKQGGEAVKGAGNGWFNDAKRKGGTETGRLSQSGSKSPARKAASAHIAKIPLVLSRHIAKAWHP